jgi:hypothetical protein
LDPAALTIILPAIIQDPASSPGKREKLCGYLERETFETVRGVLEAAAAAAAAAAGGEGGGSGGFEDRGETEAAIRGECEAVSVPLIFDEYRSVCVGC